MNCDGLLAAYFEQRDTDEPMQALRLLSDRVHFALLPAPGLQFLGEGREELRRQLQAVGASMSPPEHEVVVDGRSPVGDWEFVLGHRIVDGQRIGVFIAAAHIADGMISQYLGAFIPSCTVFGSDDAAAVES